jgi:dihydropteridine reductase
MASWFAKRQVLVVGGAGGLGRAVVGAFKTNWKVTSVDFVSNDNAHESIVLAKEASLRSSAEACKSQLTGKYQAILNVAGGWTQGSIKDIEVLQQVEEMNQANLHSSLLAAHLATKYLSDLGLLLFTGGAYPYREATPSMVAFGLSKTCTHWLALNLSVREQIPSVATVVTVLPEGILSSAVAALPGVDTKNWVEADKLAALIKKWAEGKGKPENGSYVVLKNEGRDLVPEFV